MLDHLTTLPDVFDNLPFSLSFSLLVSVVSVCKDNPVAGVDTATNDVADDDPDIDVNADTDADVHVDVDVDTDVDAGNNVPISLPAFFVDFYIPLSSVFTI